MRLEVHHIFHLSPEGTSLLKELISVAGQLVKGTYIMSAATDHLTKAVGALSDEVDSVVVELQGISSGATDAGDEATATKIDSLVDRLKTASGTAATTVEQTPPETPAPANPVDQSSLTPEQIAAGVHIDGSGNVLNADGTPFVSPDPVT